MFLRAKRGTGLQAIHIRRHETKSEDLPQFINHQMELEAKNQPDFELVLFVLFSADALGIFSRTLEKMP